MARWERWENSEVARSKIPVRLPVNDGAMETVEYM